MNIPKLSPKEQALVDANRFIYDEHFDLPLTRAVIREIMPIVNDIYFRSQLVGFEKMPKNTGSQHPLIFAGNHSGMAFPWDAIVFISSIYQQFNFDPANIIRPLVAPMLSETVLMNPYFFPNLWRHAGGIDATFLNFETMMHQSSNLLIYPEGVPGIGKGFNRKYEIQRTATSFIRMSLKYRADIIPFSTINAEYINPYSYSFDWINNLSKKIGIPFLPIGFVLPFVLLQPWVFYFAFPAKLVYVSGTRLKPYEWIDKPYEELTKADIALVTKRVKAQMQTDLDAGVEQYGQKPYQWKSFGQQLAKNWRLFPYLLPPFWSFLFHECKRQYQKFDSPDDIQLRLGLFSTLRIFLSNPILLAYFIPIVGWIPLGIIGFRKVGKRRAKAGYAFMTLISLLLTYYFLI